MIESIPKHENFDIREYLMRSIDYSLDAGKREAIHLFHRLIVELNEPDYQKALS